MRRRSSIVFTPRYDEAVNPWVMWSTRTLVSSQSRSLIRASPETGYPASISVASRTLVAPSVIESSRPLAAGEIARKKTRSRDPRDIRWITVARPIMRGDRHLSEQCAAAHDAEQPQIRRGARERIGRCRTERGQHVFGRARQRLDRKAKWLGHFGELSAV